MRKILSAFILTALVFGQSIFNSSFTSPVCADETVYDVVVYGGSSAGVAAAVQAKRMGKTAVIVCPDVHLGGLSSAGLGATDSGNRAVIGGISREFYHRLWKHYQKPEAWTWTEIPNYGMPGQGGRGFDNKTQTAWVFEPHVAEMVFEDFVKENDIPVFRGRYLDRMKKDCVQKDGTQIVSIRMKTARSGAGRRSLTRLTRGTCSQLPASRTRWDAKVTKRTAKPSTASRSRMHTTISSTRTWTPTSSPASRKADCCPT